MSSHMYAHTPARAMFHRGGGCTCAAHTVGALSSGHLTTSVLLITNPPSSLHALRERAQARAHAHTHT